MTGTIKIIKDTQTFASGFCKREFVITTDEQYAQDIQLELLKDKCTVLDNYRVGQKVNVEFNIRGSEYNGRYFVNLQAWKIDKVDGTPAPVNNPETEDIDDGSGLPFDNYLTIK